MHDMILAAAHVTVERAAPETQWLLQCDAADAGAMAAALGIALPGGMLTSAPTGAWSALHLGPDEWLLTQATDAGGDRGFAGFSAPVPFSLVDISDRSIAFDVHGPLAATLVAGGCPLDLAVLPVGACTRTLFGKATVLLWHWDGGWRISCARSFEDYVVALLRAAAEDLAGETLPG